MIAFGIDDIHPESEADGCDCSGNMENGVFRYILRLVDEFPELKITLFITPNWIYKPQPKVSKALSKFFKINAPTMKWEDDKFKLNRYNDWCNWLRNLVKTGNFEVAVHGLHHFQPQYPYSAEFKNLDYENSINRIAMAEEILYRARIPFVKVFRPPGWGMSDGLLQALKEERYVLAASSGTQVDLNKETVCNSGISGVSLLKPEKYNDLMNIPANLDISHGEKDRAAKLIKLDGHVILHGHIAYVYHGEANPNGIDEHSYLNIREIIKFVKQNYPQTSFVKFSELARLS